MLKYVSANLGLTPSSLTPLMEKTHDSFDRIGLTLLVWYSTCQGTKIIWHGGGTAGYSAFAGFDKTRRRGVVVLSNSKGLIDVEALGKLLARKRMAVGSAAKGNKISSQVYGSYVGQYRRSPDFALGMLMMRQFLVNAPKVAIYIPAGFCLAVLAILLWRRQSPQALDHPGLRGPGQWSSGGAHCAGIESRGLRAFPARHRDSP